MMQLDREEIRQIIDPLSAYPWCSAAKEIKAPKGKRWHRRVRRSIRQLLRNVTPRVGPAASHKWT